MTTYTRPISIHGTPTTGQVVKAGHVNEPIDQIYDTILAGGITADQIAAGAVNTTELATAAVTRAKMDGTVPDGSTMATSTAPTVDAGLANKLYVDNQVAIPDDDAFGDSTGNDSESNAFVKDHAYSAPTDGIVTAVFSSTENTLHGYVGSTTDPAGAGTLVTETLIYGYDSITLFVPKGKYWEIVSGGVKRLIRWQSIGTLSAPIDQD